MVSILFKNFENFVINKLGYLDKVFFYYKYNENEDNLLGYLMYFDVFYYYSEKVDEINKHNKNSAKDYFENDMALSIFKEKEKDLILLKLSPI